MKNVIIIVMVLTFGVIITDTLGIGPPSCPPCYGWNENTQRCEPPDESCECCFGGCCDKNLCETCGTEQFPCKVCDPNKTCCERQCKDKDNCKQCVNGKWVDRCTGSETCCPETGECCDTTVCEQTCVNGQCKACGGDPKKRCVNGKCEDRCRVIPDPTRFCDQHNSECGCNPIGPEGCRSKSKEWSVGQNTVCDSNCGLLPGDCNPAAETDTPCYKSRGCWETTWDWNSVCTAGIYGDYCQWTFYGFCATCEPRGPTYDMTGVHAACN